MNPFKRMEILTACVVSETSQTHREQMLKVVTDWTQEQEDITSSRDLFYALASAAVVAMFRYIEDEQANEGLRILKNLAAGIEPPPAVGVPHFHILGRWRAYVNELGIQNLNVEAFRTARADFFAGAAAMLGLTLEGKDVEDLRAELARFVEQHAAQTASLERKAR